MYGLLLESIRFNIIEKYGQEVWEKICEHSGLWNSSFTTGNNYSDAIMPKISEACAQVLPCRCPPNSYMEYFGSCFVEFTSTLGYSSVLKVYSRSFRDFLDSIDGLHEHLRFEYPRLQSPSFECTEESTTGLTLHYRSKRYGYKNYVIGQVKEIAKLYFNIEIEVKALDEADIMMSPGTRRCHITYRVIFDNNSFTPLVKDYRYLNSVSVPIDLIFKISPFSFLINRDLEIFRASNDLNQYFGENMAGKKILRVFTLRRPPVEFTWDSLVSHGHVIFELVAQQAGNISLFTGSNNTDLGELSARNSEWIERLQKIDRSAASNVRPKRKSNSAILLSSKGLSNLSHTNVCGLKPDLKRNQTMPLTNVVQKPSRDIAVIRRRSCPLQIGDILSMQNVGAVTQDWNKNKNSTTLQAGSTEDKTNESNEGCPMHPDVVSVRESVYPKSIDCEVIGSKANDSVCERILHPNPLEKHNDTHKYTSSSFKGTHHSTSCPNIDFKTTYACNALSGLRSQDTMEQEDISGVIDRATVAVPSSICPSSKTDGMQRLEDQESTRNEREKSIKEVKTASRQRKRRKLKKSHFSCSAGLFRRYVDDLPIDAEQELCTGRAIVNSARESHSKRSSIFASIEGNDLPDDSFRNEPVTTIFSSSFLRTMRRNFNRFRSICFPVVDSRASKIPSVKEPSSEKRAQASSVASGGEFGAQQKSSLTFHSEPISQKPIDEESNNEKVLTNGRVGSFQRPRKHTYDGSQMSKEEDQMGEKRKKVEMWLQRQQCRPLHLRGQVKYIAHWNMMLFIGTPIIGTVEDLQSSGLYLSDLSMHDGSRFLAMQGTQRLSEIEFACDREKLKRGLLEETTLKLEEEKRRSEEILYSMMPREIAERMKNGDRELTTCETFDDVTILFGYVADFTEICNKVEATEVVKLVREVFSLFDLLSENHKVYKFETIGGGLYMLVSGVPVKIVGHAREMSIMALSMLEKIQTVVNPFTNRPLELQIGIHSGPVVAGVIGQATLQYCLFGHTVNIASRMQTTGAKMKIHLSEATNKELAGTGFITEYRGSIPVKGVGNLDTYWLNGRDASYLNSAGAV